ncbi:lysylphosphatidylglycerol synthase domain-containing protein [Mesorhizobium sp. M0306]|uniref:lysylphosphatidylglycerol synthase domain-containing protein n=1 Tax=unclassified Mesorhizobium TaxID=325217 RepID=UPI00333B3C56
MNWRRYFWPVIGIAAVVFSLWLLLHELRGISLDDVWDGIVAIPARGWMLAALSSVIAYASLAGYDHIALLHIGRRVSWLFVTFCSFTTYALSHNIGGSVFSGAVIRYRAYGTKGLTGQDVGILVAICWITFVLSTLFVSSIVLLLEPEVIDRFSGTPHHKLSQAAGLAMLLLVAAYVFGSWLHLRPLRIGSFQLHYPALPIVARQLLVGPIELLAAAAIIFFALPATGNPGYFVVLGVFLVSFSIAQISHAPGGLGVFEVVFLAGLSHMDQVGVLAALLVFRLFYLIIPLLIALGVVLYFERSQFSRSAN